MTKVFFLWALMQTGWSATPYETSAACEAAMIGVHPALVSKAYCTEIKMLVYAAPETSPLPAPNPRRSK